MKISEMNAAELRDVIDQVRERRRVLANQTLASLRTGDLVVFNNSTKPAYLRGAHATRPLLRCEACQRSVGPLDRPVLEHSRHQGAGVHHYEGGEVMIASVFHRIDWEGRIYMSPPAEAALQLFPAGWEHAADVEVSCLEETFDLTNHVEEAWTRGPAVLRLLSPAARSTSVGDCVVLEGKFFLCASSGWVEFTPWEG